ncbi:MAG TPA: thioredoxin family protein [Phnomibacter sp.]|nr:thioredoxin family protein [Phnomibacter sp.]
MKKLVVMLGMLATMGAIAQTPTGPAKGMQFEHEADWASVLAKAKKENKYIFVDAYTTWCGPCKMMASEIFPMESVGNFYNSNFINVKVQLDTTKNDNTDVVKWYADAHEIMVKYSVRVFPTYLFIAPDGKLLHRAVGASDAATFIAKGKNALNPQTQYYSLKEKYEAGQKDPALLKALALAAVEAYDQEHISEYTNAYLASQTNLLSEENIRFMSKLTFTSKDKGFDLMMKNPAAFDAVLGKGYAKTTSRMIVMQEEVYPVIWNPEGIPANWAELEKKLAAKYPANGKEYAAYAKVNYLMSIGNWDDFAPAITAYMRQYGTDVSPIELNNFAWAIFENCADMNCVEQALQWAKRAMAEKEPNYYDTYANLLYKSGKRTEAIKAQEATVALAKSMKHANLPDFEAALTKMKAGQKTW